MPTFDFEQLDVFSVAIDMVICVDRVASGLPRGRGYMTDQLRRAANSVVLNIAEGTGEYAPAEKARFYRMAKRSAAEVAAQLVVIDRLSLGEEAVLEEARGLLYRVVCMLVRMAENARDRAGPARISR